ncbi:MAG: hypothetical protein BJ554DRAFT_3063 [Olpidium bornovanus]|uniref:Cytoplasmic dynein 2 light intermediate chain 1 n=1 Tax=Olpidium bornovanus TaxID=278681 RepID=A0A8H7ZPX8_9FUNG|nr:MAG: hypothetical protein BJ554DRAFT_3063 [Olpidium bornovanus]
MVLPPLSGAAGGTSLIDLASIPLAESNIHHSAVTLVLDLSQVQVHPYHHPSPSSIITIHHQYQLLSTITVVIKAKRNARARPQQPPFLPPTRQLNLPLNEIVPLVDTLLDKLAKEVNRILDSLEKRGSKRPKALRAHALKRFGPEHADLAGGGGLGHLVPFPVPAVIIGTKHDVFRDFDSEQRKVVCKYLRAVAHTHGASLVFFGLKDEPSVARTKGLLNHYAFRTNTPRGNVCQVDHNKPLFVYSGADSFANIGPAPRPTPGNPPLGAWRGKMLQLFPPKAVPAPAGEDAAAPSPSTGAKYPEPAVDAMRAQKDEELERYKKAAEKRAKEVAMLAAAGFAEGEGPKKAGKPYSRARAAGGLVAGVKG